MAKESIRIIVPVCYRSWSKKVHDTNPDMNSDAHMHPSERSLSITSMSLMGKIDDGKVRGL